jgi:hypothetical protein
VKVNLSHSIEDNSMNAIAAQSRERIRAPKFCDSGLCCVEDCQRICRTAVPEDQACPPRFRKNAQEVLILERENGIGLTCIQLPRSELREVTGGRKVAVGSK